MTARIAGFRSRADLGLRAPRSVSRSIDRDAGLTLHYGGDGRAPSRHADCEEKWRDWQAFHMRPVAQGGRGWVDIAYSFGFCDHGYVFAGRGRGVRTAANGTNTGNQESLAACWMGGSGSVPSQAALDAADWLIAENRRQGGRNRVWDHSDWKPTACAGRQLRAHANLRDRAAVPLPAPAPAPKPAPVPQEDDMPTLRPGLTDNNYVRLVQRAVNEWARVTGFRRPALVVDGDYGGNTAGGVADYQRAAGLLAVPGVVAGHVDPLTAARLFQYDPQRPR